MIQASGLRMEAVFVISGNIRQAAIAISLMRLSLTG
jgi:hypothetical protein